MQYFFVKVLKKLSAFFRIKFLSDLYKNVFLFFCFFWIKVLAAQIMKNTIILVKIV